MKKAMSIYAVYVLLIIVVKFQFDDYKSKRMHNIDLSVDSLVNKKNDYTKDYISFKIDVELNLNKDNKDSLLNVAEILKDKAVNINHHADSLTMELESLAKLEPYEYASKNLYVYFILGGFVVALIIGGLTQD